MNDQDQIYINSVQEQINFGMYDHLFYSGYGDEKEEKSDLVFLDIGANIGLVSIYAIPFCQYIVAVEPAPNTFRELIKIEANGTTPEIKCVQAALAPVDGPHEFFVNDVNFTASSTVNTYGQRIIVEGKTLTTILKENGLIHVDVCKIDAEGAEGEALNLDQLESASGIIDQWWIEFHNCPKTTWEHKLGTTVGNFLRCGYHNMEIRGMALWVKGRS